jgi:hypothetical protein
VKASEFEAQLFEEIAKRTEGLTDEEYLATLALLLEGVDNIALWGIE